jgi:hypothetical protein
MLDKDAKGAANRFMANLEGKQFTMARSQNTEDDYTATKQERDSSAIEEFVKTDVFQDIMRLK